MRFRAAYARARPWILLVAGAAVALAASAAIGIAAIERASKGPAFRVSAACLRLNATVRQELGVVTGFGFTVQGPVVQNDTRVLPVRVRARRETGGEAEVLLLEPRPDGSWEALARPARRLRDGETVTAGQLAITIERHLDGGRVLVRPRVPAPGSI